MLSKPHAGWSNFQLEGTGKYELSYLDDITENIDEWVSFVSYENFNFDEKKQRLESSLEKLKELIEKRTSYFNEHSCFL